MNSKEFKQIICESKYYTKYEAIIDKNSMDIYAYEALSKFELADKTISTEEIFKKLHHNNKLFFELEKRNKQLQVNNYDFNDKLFLNFDADIFVEDYQQKYWKEFLTNYKHLLVVEITENGSDDEVSSQIMKNFSSWLEVNKIDAALDDFAQDGSMFSFFMMDKSKYIKIDKSFIRKVQDNKKLFSLLRRSFKNNKFKWAKIYY